MAFFANTIDVVHSSIAHNTALSAFNLLGDPFTGLLCKPADPAAKDSDDARCPTPAAIPLQPQKMLKMLIPFQFIPLTATWWCIGLSTGLLKTSSMPMGFIIIIGTFSLYAFLMRIFIRMYRDKESMAIYPDGRFRFFPVVKPYEIQLPLGAVVQYDDEKVEIKSGLDRISSFKSRGGIVTIKLPNGLDSVGSGSFVIVEEP